MQAGQLVNLQRSPRYLPFACAALLAAASVLLPFYIPVLHGVPFACSFVAIAAAAHFWGFGPALLSAAISLIGVNVLVMGTRYHFELDASSLIQTGVSGVVAVILARLVRQRDVARTAEQRSHASLDAALRSIADAVLVTDTAANIVFLNPAAERFTGWSVDTAIGRPIHEVLIILNETTREPVENPVDRVLATGEIVGLANHTVLVRKDGSEFPIDDSAAPTRDVTGQVTGAVLVFRDIGEQRQLERQRDASLIQAQRAADFFRLSAQASLVAAWDYDYATEIANWAEGSYPVWGVPFDEVKTLDGMFARIVAEYREPIRAEITRCVESRDTYCVEFPLIAAEGSDPRWCEARGVPMIDEEGKVIGLRGTTIDITHRKLSEQALLRSEKLAAAGRLAASVAHEINNPLESAINLVYLASLQAKRSHEDHEYLRQAELQLQRVSHIARQSLSFYRDSLSPTLYRPAEPIRDVVSVLQLRGGAETVRLECRLDEYLQVLAAPEICGRSLPTSSVTQSMQWYARLPLLSWKARDGSPSACASSQHLILALGEVSCSRLQTMAREYPGKRNRKYSRHSSPPNQKPVRVSVYG